ncbi:unnamed protein product [Closterium sp. NIES-53]
MASLCVVAFAHEGHPIQFDKWLDDLQLYLLSDSRDSVPLFDHTFGASPAPPATSDTKCAHFRQHRTAQALYDAVVARYASPTTDILGRLLLPYLFPEPSAFATVEDLVTHLRTSDARYRAALPAEFLDRNPPPMDHFLALDPTALTVDLLEQHLLAAETSVVAVGAAHGTPHTPFFEGMSGLLLLVGRAATARARVAGVVAVAAGVVVGAAVEVVEAVEVVAVVGVVAGVGALVAAVLAAVGVAVVAAVGVVAVGLELFSGERGASGGSGSCPYVIRMGDCAGQTCGKPHTQHRCFSCLDDAWRAEFGDDAGQSCLEAAALVASESALPGTAPAEALHTFTLDSRGPIVARSSTVLPCLAVPSSSLSGLHLPSFFTNWVSTVALQDAMVTTTTVGGQRVSICTCKRTGRHLATFTRRPRSSLYILATKPPQIAASAQVSTSGPVAPPCSCRLLSHQTLLWHHRLGHPSLPCLRGMHSRLLVSGLPRSLPPLPPSPAAPCLPCVELRQRTAPQSSSFPPTISPLQTLHMDLRGQARVSGQGRKRYFLLVVDEYTRYTMVIPLRSKGEVPDVLIPWIRAVRLQLRERFTEDLPVLRLQSKRGGEFSSDLLRDFCRGEGILQSFTLPVSPKENVTAERRIGLVMEVARTSTIHVAAPHFLWPFAVRYAAHQLNLWPLVSLPETSPTLRWTREVGDASVFRVWGSRAFVRDMSADKLSARAIPCVFLGFPRDAPGWQFYHPTSRRVFPSKDVTLDESVPLYRLFPYRSAPPPPPLLFLAPGPPSVDSLSPHGPAPSGVSQVDPLPGTVPVEVAVSSGAASGGAEPGGAASGGVEPGGAQSEGAGSGGAERGGADPAGVEPRGAKSEGVESGGAEPSGVEPGGAESGGAECGGAEPQGTASSGGPAGASPRMSPRPKPLFPQQLREWFAQCTRLWIIAGAGGTKGVAAVGLGGARTRGTGAATIGSVGGTGVRGAGDGDPTETGGAGAGGAGAGGSAAGGAG